MKIVAAPGFVLIFLLAFTSCDQLKEPYKTPTSYSYLVSPQSTSDSIKTSTIFHSAFVDTRISNGKLFVFLGGTGSTPQNYASLNKAAKNLGYYVINLSYLNTVDGQACKDRSDPNCFANYHEEMIFGGLQSDLVDVNNWNSISNRILKLLQHLHKINPSNGWDQFYDGSELLYSKFVLSGHSQGGGHAAYLAQKYSVDHVVLFSSPNDYSDVTSQPAAWCKNEFATSMDRCYGLAHKRDDAFAISKQYAVWKDIGMLEAADTSSADSSNFANYKALVTDMEPNLNAKDKPLYHNLTAKEYALPAGDERKQLKKVWLYMLGYSGR